MTPSKRKPLPTHLPENRLADHLGLERLVFFSDAVFAIAITLLALDIRLPTDAVQLTNQELFQRLLGLAPQYLSFVISFLVIGSFWAAHNRQFRLIRRYDGTLVFLNLLLLLVIAFIPFPTRVLSEQGNCTATIFYALIMALPGLLAALMWGYAVQGNRLVDADLTPADRRRGFLRNLIAPTVFLLSIGVALIDADLAKYTWFLIALGHRFVRERSNSNDHNHPNPHR